MLIYLVLPTWNTQNEYQSIPFLCHSLLVIQQLIVLLSLVKTDPSDFSFTVLFLTSLFRLVS